MADMTYDEGMFLLKSAFTRTRAILSDPTLFLYIVHAYYEGWLEDGNKRKSILDSDYDELPADKPLENLARFMSSSDSNSVSFLRPGFYKIYSSYKDYSAEFTDIYRFLRSIPVSWFEQNSPNNPSENIWGTAFDEILSIINQSLGKAFAEFTQPQEITSLIKSLREYLNPADILGECTVYDPFAGIGAFLSPGSKSYAHEINERTYALCRLRTLAMGYGTNATDNYYLGDSTREWAKIGAHAFDFIVSFPPIGLRLPTNPEMDIDWPAQKISLEDYLICKGANSLAEGGFLIGVFSNSIQFATGATGAQREKLVRDKRVRMVIQLPANLFSFTSISTSVVVLSDKTTANEEILFIDASSFYIKERRRNVLSAEIISKVLYTCQSEDFASGDLAQYAARVPVEEVIANDCILTPFRYISSSNGGSLNIPEGFEAIPLSEIVTISRGIPAETPEIRAVRGKDLSSIEEAIGYRSFENLLLEATPTRATVIKEDSILVLRIGNLKPTLFRPASGVDVALTSNISALVPKEGIDPFYLVSELRKPYVAEQVASLSQGTTIPYLKNKDLLSILVLLPIERSLQHQTFLNNQRVSEEQRMRELKVEEYVKRERARMSEMMSIRRHRINPYISGLKSNVTMLLEEMYSSGQLDAQSELSSNYTVQDALENMEENLIQLKSLFDAFTVDTNVGVVESVDLIPFLKQYSFTHTMPDRQFELDKSLLESAGKFPHVAFNHGNLKEILDEIIHNAEKHFAPNTSGFSVMFVPRFDGRKVSLLICNNGEPVPADFDEERSFAAGYHKDANGTGQGLFRVRQVCDEFGAKVAWENDPDNLMPTGLCITFSSSTD